MAGYVQAGRLNGRDDSVLQQDRREATHSGKEPGVCSQSGEQVSGRKCHAYAQCPRSNVCVEFYVILSYKMDYFLYRNTK